MGLLLDSRPGWSILRENEQSYELASAAVRPQVQNGQVVFAPDIGLVGWRLENAKILDPVGLVSPESLPYHRNRQRFEVVFPQIVREQQPDWVFSRSIYLAGFLQDPWFTQHYTPVYERQELLGQAGSVVVYRRR